MFHGSNKLFFLEFFPLYKCKCWFTQDRDFFGGEFSPFGKKYYGKRKENVKNFPLKKNCHFQKKDWKNLHNCLQFERVLKIVYFHILNIVKFG
jgi:hypothetical protein